MSYIAVPHACSKILCLAIFVHACSDAATAFVIHGHASFKVTLYAFDKQIKISQSCLGQMCEQCINHSFEAHILFHHCVLWL